MDKQAKMTGPLHTCGNHSNVVTDKRNLYKTAWVVGCNICIGIISWNGKISDSRFLCEGTQGPIWILEGELERFVL